MQSICLPQSAYFILQCRLNLDDLTFSTFISQFKEIELMVTAQVNGEPHEHPSLFSSLNYLFLML